MRQVETSQRLNIILTVIIVAGIGIFAWHNWIAPSKSNAQKQAECAKNAGQVYDTERGIIARSSYQNEAERSNYYQTTADAYAKDLANCRELYP